MKLLSFIPALIGRFPILEEVSRRRGADKLEYYKCRGFFPAVRWMRAMRANIRSDRSKIEGGSTGSSWSGATWIFIGDRARKRDKSSFRDRVRNSAFWREFCVSAGFRPGFAGFGISEMRSTAPEECLLQNFITLPERRPRRYVTLPRRGYVIARNRNNAFHNCTIHCTALLLRIISSFGPSFLLSFFFFLFDSVNTINDKNIDKYFYQKILKNNELSIYTRDSITPLHILISLRGFIYLDLYIRNIDMIQVFLSSSI